jgi:hypothetical protein
LSVFKVGFVADRAMNAAPSVVRSAEARIEGRHEGCGKAAGRIEDRPARLEDGRAVPFEKARQLAGRAESGGLPRPGAEPATDAPERRPEAPPAKLADDHPPAGPEHARDLGDGPICIADEAQDRHGNDPIERLAPKGQRFGSCANQPERVRTGPRGRRDQHARVRIESGHPSATAEERGCQGSIATTDIEHVEPIDGPQQLEDKTLLKQVSDPTEATIPPARIGFGKP